MPEPETDEHNMPQYDDYEQYDQYDESVESPRAPRPRDRRPQDRRPQDRRSAPPPMDDGDEMDPLDDPRAPRSLRRSPPPSPRRPQDRRSSRPSLDDSAEMPYGGGDDRDNRRGGPAGGERRSSRPPAYEDDRRGYSSRGRGGAPRPPSYPDQRERYDPRGGGYDDHYGGPPARYDDRYGGGYDESAALGTFDSSAYDAPPSEEYPTPRRRPRGGHGSPAMWLSASLPVPGPGPKKRRVPVVVVLVVALMALAIPGVLLGPKLLAKVQGTGEGAYSGPKGTFTPGPTPTTQAHFKKYVSPRSLYSMDYPDTWAIASKEQAVQGQYDHIDVFAPATQGAVNSLLVEQAAAASNVADAQVIASEVAGAQQNGVTFKPTADQPVPVNVGGEFWQRQDFTVTGGGVTVHEAILAGHHQGRSYVIVLVSSTTAFSDDSTKYFTPALKSFRFN